MVWAGVGFAVLVGAACAIEGPELAATLADAPTWALIGAVVAQLTWLACRGEAWRLRMNAVRPSGARGAARGVAGL